MRSRPAAPRSPRSSRPPRYRSFELDRSRPVPPDPLRPPLDRPPLDCPPLERPPLDRLACGPSALRRSGRPSSFTPYIFPHTQRAAPIGAALCYLVVRRRPTLPHCLRCSTIGAGGLSFRVRNGSGRFPSAVAAVTLWFCLVVGSGVYSGREYLFLGSSPRPISTSLLNTLLCLHVWPINPVFWLGALPPFQGWETSSGSRLPA